jgi:O-antigen/teichoic acid export membrane protein
MFWCNSAIVVPICLGICLLSPFILRVYGNGFESGIFAFCLVALANGFGTIYQPMWNYLVGAGMMWTNFITVFITAVIQIGLAYLLVSYGAEGLAEASLLTTILRLVVLVVLFKFFIPANPYKNKRLKT